MERTERTRLAVLLGLVSLLTAASAAADHNRRGSGSQPGANRSTRSVPGTVHQPNRYLLPPAGLGSAANAPPGFYRQLDAPPATHRPRGAGRRGAGPVYVPVPYVVYVEPPELAVSPVQYEPPPPRDDRPRYVPAPAQAPAPQPVYIVQPSPAAAPPAPPVRQSAPETRDQPPAAPKSREPVDVTFSIRPAAATVYLDDEPLGTGDELMRRDGAMRLRPGVHVLEVVHPEYDTQRLVFGLSSADPIEVQIDLTTERAGRRSRIR